MAFERLHSELAWPTADEVFRPKGAGPAVLAAAARRKIGQAIDRLDPNLGIEIGTLPRDPASSTTEVPFAIVGRFQRPIKQTVLRELHRLAWNLSLAPMLVTVEPHLLRVWSCCEPPQLDQDADANEIVEVRSSIGDPTQSLSQSPASALHWMELLSGRFFRTFQDRFHRDRCADCLLLANLKEVRKRLIDDQGLDEDVCHDLLARLIFVQFLWDRRDSSGRSALSSRKLRQLHEQQILRERHSSVEELLRHYHDTYRLFQYLNSRFNGDLFPGNGNNKTQQNAEWAAEKRNVTPEHIETLADFVGGKMEMARGQRLLWREYAFDVIPIEFISSIYEEFVTGANKQKQSGTVYTPPHLVDFMLDKVLPWEGDEWDLRILDPACGSGIFLVKAYQRLIHRWKHTHQADPSPKDLRRLLEHNLFGVDVDSHAVRVASFSLYLAMCEEIDPKYYWSRVGFPPLRNKNIVHSDFFVEDQAGFRSEEERHTFDVVVGNPPWGRNTVGHTDVSKWTLEGWESPDNSIGQLFIPKSARLVKKGGAVSLLQPSGLLTNSQGTAHRFREKLFNELRVDEVVNLSALRFGLYRGAIGPSCIVSFTNEDADNETIVYVSPKETKSLDDDIRVVIEPMDIQEIRRDDALNAFAWCSLSWGGPRDIALVRKLLSRRTIGDYVSDGVLVKRRGIVRSDKRRLDKETIGRRILESPDFPQGTFLTFDAHDLPVNEDGQVHSRESTDYRAFALPQLLIKQGWRAASRRFEAAVVSGVASGVLCTQNFTTVHATTEFKDILTSACMVLNSKVATYVLTMSSGQMAHYIPKVSVNDLMNVPIPGAIDQHGDVLASLEDVDRAVVAAFGLDEFEQMLVDDLFNVTLADFKGGECSPGRQILGEQGRVIMREYCDVFRDITRAGFGEDKRIAATVVEPTTSAEPVCVVSFHLDSHDGTISYEKCGSSASVWAHMLSIMAPDQVPGIRFQRIARIYATLPIKGPTITLVKPDQYRYWTRSMAMRDADDVCADIIRWSTAGEIAGTAVE